MDKKNARVNIAFSSHGLSNSLELAKNHILGILAFDRRADDAAMPGSPAANGEFVFVPFTDTIISDSG